MLVHRCLGHPEAAIEATHMKTKRPTQKTLAAIRSSRAYAKAKRELEAGERKAQAKAAGELITATNTLMARRVLTPKSAKLSKEFAASFFGLKNGGNGKRGGK